MAAILVIELPPTSQGCSIRTTARIIDSAVTFTDVRLGSLAVVQHPTSSTFAFGHNRTSLCVGISRWFPVSSREDHHSRSADECAILDHDELQLLRSCFLGLLSASLHIPRQGALDLGLRPYRPK